MLKSAPRIVTGRNLYLDQTPLDLVTGVVTEDAVFDPSSLRSRLNQSTLDPALAR